MILPKLYSHTPSQAIIDIFVTYQKNGHCIVNFLYFANAMKHRLLESPQTQQQKDYQQALLDADYLLPDGIALQLFSKRVQNQKLYNCNGTDLIPPLLAHLANNEQSYHLAIYSLYDPRINKWPERLDRWVQHIQDAYWLTTHFAHQALYADRHDGFDFIAYQQSLQNFVPSALRLLIVCTGTPTQELRTHKHLDFFHQHNILLINAGGRIDFAAGYETRAPQRVVKARVLETFRRIITNPRKNLFKFISMFGILRLLHPKNR